MSKNNNLHSAKKAKNDEFYTRIDDVEKELKHYKDFFKGKKVLCNCNDGKINGVWSAFAQYFSMNFEHLGLEKLTCVSYNEDGHGMKYVYCGDKNGNHIADDFEWEVSELNGHGDFSDEDGCQLMQECDVVVTNPPFSLFRDFVAQLMEYNKKFLIIGNNNAVTYKEIFPLIKDGKMWLGRTLFTGKMPFFKVPSDYDINNNRFEVRKDGIYKQVNAVCWFTNIYNQTNKEVLDVYCKYNKIDYPKYDNYDAINCDVFANLPMDYDGVIGVPITSLKYLWDDGTLHVEINGATTQFEIVDAREIGLTDRQKNKSTMLVKDADSAINGKPTYARILIRKK